MAHRYLIREIAQQSGLSEATVDRVLNKRPGVRASTIAEVEQAVMELDRQQSQLRISGRTFLVDLVMQAPERFTSAVRRSLEVELPGLRPAVVRSRFHFREHSDPDELAQLLDAVRKRGSHGILLKAPDHPSVVEAIDRLADDGIPVITLVTDVPLSRRLAYVGIDNRSAGATAAYLVTQWSRSEGTVLVTISNDAFRGEEEREMGFRQAMRSMAPSRGIVTLTETDGLDSAMFDQVTQVLAGDASVDAVYSIGGGNNATFRSFDEHGRRASVFVAHDLDADNTILLRRRRISAVLHHDLRADMRRASRYVMQAHGALAGVPHSIPSPVHVVTPFNEPSSMTQ
ncbi:MAG: LacI family transcriptional regulator [Aeromicrobium sp.]|nr:LacI family transcriptional regulator [Aeromicrobium sp.]